MKNVGALLLALSAAACARDDDARAAELRNRAAHAERQLDWPGAVRLYEEAQRIRPTPEVVEKLRNARLQLAKQKARLASQAGRWEEAARACEEALAIAPDPEMEAQLAWYRAQEPVEKARQAADWQKVHDLLAALQGSLPHHASLQERLAEAKYELAMRKGRELEQAGDRAGALKQYKLALSYRAGDDAAKSKIAELER